MGPIQKNLFHHSIIPVFDESIEVKWDRKRNPTAIQIKKERWKKLTAKEILRKEQRQIMRSVIQKESANKIPHCWARPVNSIRTSKFASHRSLPNGKTYFHSGVDLRARTGTPIKSAADGKIVFAGKLIVSGNIVVIDHGQGLYTRYMHLNEIHVKPHQRVQKGETLGLAGATGRVEAAHLHWEIIWKKKWLSPLKFVSEMNRLYDPVCQHKTVSN